MEDRIDATCLGRNIGTCTGWDGDEVPDFWIYDFIPSNGVNLPACSCLFLQYSTGKIIAQDNEGNTLVEHDMVALFNAR